jgi:hypothetical protein
MCSYIDGDGNHSAVSTFSLHIYRGVSRRGGGGGFYSDNEEKTLKARKRT